MLFEHIVRKDVCDGHELLERLNQLRGLFAIEIVIGHVGNQYPQSQLYLFGKFMIISVGFFFFISGYGVEKNFLKNGKYLHGFLGRKERKLLLLAIEAFIFAVIIDFITKSDLGYIANDRGGIV